MLIHSVLLFTVVSGSGITSVIAANVGSLLASFQPNKVCQKIKASTSTASAVYYNASAEYGQDISHWASSSTQTAACSFEPGTVEDVGIALQILGKSQTPFAVKGGGHATNPGFSSTPGVLIAMSRFSEVSYNSTDQSATVGAGLIWDDVYAALGPYGVNVVGARVSGVGVAGFTLGGGYSWLTNQYGLAIDNVRMFEVVLPDGTVTHATETANPDLFFALKGGLNNFGIVTRFTFKTFPQTQVWGGTITYGATVLDQVTLATANFAANHSDPRAGIITSYTFVPGQSIVQALIFYDGPSPPPGVFDEFLAIPPLLTDISTRSYLSLVRSAPSNATSGSRGIFNTVPVENYSLSLLESIANETIRWGESLTPQSGILISYSVEPFLPTLLSHSTTPSAYPPSRAVGYLPLLLYFAWVSPASDETFQNATRTSAETLKALAIQEGQTGVANAPMYPNYAIFDTPLADLYGTNLPRLKEIKDSVDPDNVMGLAGGFKI